MCFTCFGLVKFHTSCHVTKPYDLSVMFHSTITQPPWRLSQHPLYIPPLMAESFLQCAATLLYLCIISRQPSASYINWGSCKSVYLTFSSRPHTYFPKPLQILVSVPQEYASFTSPVLLATLSSPAIEFASTSVDSDDLSEVTITVLILLCPCSFNSPDQRFFRLQSHISTSASGLWFRTRGKLGSSSEAHSRLAA